MKIGVIGIIVEKNKESAMSVQGILSDFSDIIVGRMGIPNANTGINVISVIVEGTVERISALSGKLGKLPNVKVKSAVTDILNREKDNL